MTGKAQIFFVRRAAKRSQAEQARRMGIHFVTLSRLENYRIVPTPELAATIGKETKQSPGEVIDEYIKHVRKVAL